MHLGTPCAPAELVESDQSIRVKNDDGCIVKRMQVTHHTRVITNARSPMRASDGGARGNLDMAHKRWAERPLKSSPEGRRRGCYTRKSSCGAHTYSAHAFAYWPMERKVMARFPIASLHPLSSNSVGLAQATRDVVSKGL